MEPGTNAIVDASLTFVQGKSWNGIPYYPITWNDAPPVDAVASASMVFTKAVYDAAQSITLTSPLSSGIGINILDAAGWTFQVPAQNLPLSAGAWVWTFNTVDVNGIAIQWETGIIKVLPPIPTF